MAKNLQVKIIGDASSYSRALNQAANSTSGFGRTLSRVGIAAGATLVGMGAFAVKAAVDFESSFAGVRKTVNGTEAELKDLADGFLDLSKRIPVNVNELNRIGEAAGQLGIKRKSILQFTEVIAKLGVSTNLAGEEGAAMLARFANVTKLPQGKFDRLGATIVALGNAGASTEAEIAEMALRIAGAGTVVGISQPKILGLANALSSLGIEAESGGSAISTTMILIAKSVESGGAKLAEFARVSGMSVEEFRTKWKTDAAGALTAFIEGLGRLRSSGENVFGTLDKLGLGGIRIRDTLLRASGAGDLLRKSLELSEKAWKENIALNKEAEQRFKTTASQIQLLKNNVSAVAIVLGAKLLPAFNTALLAVTDFFRRFGEAEGFRAKMNIIWEGVESAGRALFDKVKESVAAVDWTGLFREAKGISEGLSLRLQEAFAAVDWNLVGDKIAAGLGVALSNAGAIVQTLAGNISAAVDAVDWEKVGQKIGGSVSKGVAGGIEGKGGEGVTVGSVLIAFKKLSTSIELAAIDFTVGFTAAILRGVRSGLGSLGTELSNIVGRAIQSAARSVQGAASGMRTNFERVGVAAVQGLGSGLKGLLLAVLGKLAQAAASVFGFAKTFFSAAAHIGQSIADGVVSGISGLAGRLKNAIEGAIGSALSRIDIPGFSPPEHAAAEAIGKPLGEGVIKGWLVSTATLPEKMGERLKAAIERGRQVILSSRSAFTSAFEGLSSRILRAFDAETNAMETASEKRLREIQERREMEDLLSAQSSAQDRLNKLMAEGGTGEEFTAAQRDVQRAQEDIDAVNLRKQAADERTQLDSRREEQRLYLEERLRKLGEHFEKEGATVKGALATITKLMKSFGVDFATAGALVGKAFVQGLKNAISGSAVRAGNLEKLIERLAAELKIPELDTGGTISRTGMAVVHRGETILPSSRGAGAPATINVYVSGSVQTEQDLVYAIRDGLNRVSANNSGNGLS